MKKNSKKIWNYALMLLITVLTLGPFLITLFMSLKSSGQGNYDGLLPTEPTLANFFTAFKKAN